MRAGSLRHKVTLQTATVTKDRFNATVMAWDDFREVSASIETLKGYDRASAAATWPASDVKICIRYVAGVLPAMRVLHGDTIYSILGVNDVDGRRREIELTCETGKKAT